jgi:hypothetical protein
MKENRDKNLFKKTLKMDITEAKITDKQIKKLSEEIRAGYLGIFWVSPDLDKVIYIHQKPLEECSDSGGGWLSAGFYHADVWEEHKENAVKQFEADPDEYASIPRGRVEFNFKKKKFVVLVGNWVKNDVLEKIVKTFNIPIKNFKREKNMDYDEVANLINKHPRKCLGWLSPIEFAEKCCI